MTLAAETFREKMVASWRMNRGFFGWRIAQIRRIRTSMMKLKIRSPAQHLRSTLRRLLLWWLHTFSVIVAAAEMGVVWELENGAGDKSGMENVGGLSTNIGWIDEMGSKPVYAFLV